MTRFTMTIILAILLPTSAAQAQELSTAAYLGALDGAVEACAAAYPEHATRYRQAVKRLLSCHLDDAGIAAWRARLRGDATTARQYAEAHAAALRDLSGHPANRRRQCASLDTLRCDPAANPAAAN